MLIGLRYPICQTCSKLTGRSRFLGEKGGYKACDALNAFSEQTHTAKDDGSHDDAGQAGDDERVRPEVRAADGGILRSNQSGALVFGRNHHHFSVLSCSILSCIKDTTRHDTQGRSKHTFMKERHMVGLGPSLLGLVPPQRQPQMAPPARYILRGSRPTQNVETILILFKSPENEHLHPPSIFSRELARNLHLRGMMRKQGQTRFSPQYRY